MRDPLSTSVPHGSDFEGFQGGSLVTPGGLFGDSRGGGEAGACRPAVRMIAVDFFWIKDAYASRKKFPLKSSHKTSHYNR